MKPKVVYIRHKVLARIAVYWYEDEPRTGYIADLYVKPKYRGLGLGNYMLHQAEQYLIDREFSKAYLRVGNLPFLKQWYCRKGYKPINRKARNKWLFKILHGIWEKSPKFAT